MMFEVFKNNKNKKTSINSFINLCEFGAINKTREEIDKIIKNYEYKI